METGQIIMAALVFFGVLTVAILFRHLIALAIFLTAVVALLVYYGTDPIRTIATIAFTSTYSWELTSLPLFIFMGTAMLQTGLSGRLFRGLAPVCSYMPGGLQQANILFSAVFAAMCGSGSAAIATLTTVAAPEFEKRPQYRMYNALGSIAGGHVLGTTIPPSVVLIIYGALVGESIANLFIAGIIPGIIEGGTQMAFIAADSLVRREGKLETHMRPLMFIKETLQAWPAGVLIFLALVTIYTGVATPSEAGALGAAGALGIGLLYRELTWKKLAMATRQATLITGMFGLSYMGARVYSFAASSLYLPQLVTNAFIDSGLGITGVVIMVLLLGLVLGMFGGSTMMLLVIAPLIYPVIQELGAPLGWDGIWLGIVLVLVLDQGGLTPPVGYAVFVISAFTKRTNEYIFRGSNPYIVCIWVATIVVTLIPQLATWLPSTMK